MKSRLILLLLAAHAGTALAQYKCTAANGAITFQQTPCFGAKSEEKLVIIPNGHPPPASGATASSAGARPASAASAPHVQTGMERALANNERQLKRNALEQAVNTAKDDQASRAAQRTQAIDEARRRFGGDPANAAALQDALTSIDKRYSAMSDLDDSRIKSAKAALDDWDHAVPAK